MNDREKIIAELQATGLPWEIKLGSRHEKIYVDEKFVGILPHGRMKGSHDRAVLNVRSQIRRAAKGQQDGRRKAA